MFCPLHVWRTFLNQMCYPCQQSKALKEKVSVSPPFCYSCESDISLLWLSHTGDPLIHHGQHFGRTVHAMCNVQVLIINCLLLVSEADSEVQVETLNYEFIPGPILSSSSLLMYLWAQGQKGVSSVLKALTDGTTPLWAPHGSLWQGVHVDGWFSMSDSQFEIIVSHIL